MRSYPKLYRSDETNFAHNGLGVLKDCILCEVIEERNGKFELELTYKVGSFLCEQLKEDNIIKSNANPKLFNQKFRIYKTIKQLDGNIKIYAQHISYDLATDIVETVTVNGNCQMALQSIFDNSQLSKHYVGKSNIGMTSNFHLEFVNCLEAIAGVKGSILDTFGNGAEILRDNEIIRIEQNRGRDSNILISYKKNLTGLNAEVDWSNMCTRLFPYAKVQGSTVDKSEEIITLDEKFIDSGFINNYSKPFIKFMEFTGVSNKDELKVKALNYMNNTASDTPKVNYTINFVPLSKTVEYKDYALLEDIDLCDTVIVRDSRYGIDIKLKCIAYKYNPLTGRCNSIILGSPKTSLAAATAGKDDSKDNIQNTSNDWDKILQDAIKDMTDKITGNQGGHVVLYPPENPAELFFMDTPNVNTSKTVLRINKSGIGFSKTGVNGPYLTGWDLDGNFLADCITTGTLNANLIKAGILSSFNNLFSINMETGQFRFQNSIVDFGDNGVKVSHSQSDTYSEMSSEGYKVLTNSGRELASFGENNKAIINEVETNIVNSPTVMPQIRNKGEVNIYVSTTGSGDMTGRNDSNRANSVLSALSYLFSTYGINWDAMSGMMLTNTTINIYLQGSGSYTENIYLRDFLGEGLINFVISKDLELTGSWSFSNCKRIYMNGNRTSHTANDGARFKRNGSYDSLYFHSCLNVELLNFRFYSSVQSHSGLSCRYGSNVYVATCDFYGGNHAIYLDNNSKCHTYNTRGHNFGIRAYTINQGCFMVWERSTPTGSKASFLSGYGTETIGEGVASSENNSVQVVPPPPSNQIFTQDFSPSSYRSVRSSGTQSGTFKQGYWEAQWGNYNGYANFGNAVKDWLANAQGGVTMQVYLQRMNDSHGYSSSVPVLLSGNNVGSLARGEGKWFNVPASVVTSLQGGGELLANGYGQTQYIKFETNIKLRVTATKPA